VACGTWFYGLQWERDREQGWTSGQILAKILSETLAKPAKKAYMLLTKKKIKVTLYVEKVVIPKILTLEASLTSS